MGINEFLTCPANCNDDLNLGALDVDQDCTNYDIYDSQICDVLIKPDSALVDPITWGTISPKTAEVDLAQIDNSSIDGTLSKLLSGIGGIAEPEEVVANYPKLKTKVTKYIYTMNFRILNLSEDQYDTLRQFQCGWTSFTFRYGSLGGFLYGGENGIVPKSARTIFPKGEGDTDKDECILRITWEANGDPDRNISPF
jgi:hypothetical protein